MKSLSRRTLVLVALALPQVICSQAQAGQIWDGDVDGNWNNGNNWSGNTTPGYGTLIFSGGNNRATNQNLGNPLNMHRIDINVSTGNGFSFAGNQINFFDNAGQISRIENQGSLPAVFTLPINFADNGVRPAELNPVGGNLTVNSLSMTNSVTQIEVYGTRMLTINGIVSGTGKAFVVKGAADVVFNASNSYTGDTTIETGTLSYGQGGQTQSPFHRIGVSLSPFAAALQITDTDGGTALNNAFVIRSGSGARRMLSTNTSGTNTFSGNVFMDGNLATSVTAGGTVAFTGGNFDLKNQTLTVGGAGNTLVTQGLDNATPTDTGNLVKNEGGSLYLQGTSTYRGSTNVNGGTLFANHTHNGPATATYTVNTGATLAGNGTLPSNVLINDGGKLAPGSSIGPLTIDGALTLNPTSTLEIEFDADGPIFDADLVTVGTGLDVSGGQLTFVFTPAVLATFSPGVTFVIVLNDSGSAPPAAFLSTPLESDQLQYDIVYDFEGEDARGVVGNGNDIAVTFQAVPEPGTISLVGLLAVTAMKRRLRR